MNNFGKLKGPNRRSMSFDFIRNQISEKVKQKFGKKVRNTSDGEVATISDFWVKDVYLDHAIIEKEGDLFKLPYDISRDGDISIGDLKEVKIVYEPVKNR